MSNPKSSAMLALQFISRPSLPFGAPILDCLLPRFAGTSSRTFASQPISRWPPVQARAQAQAQARIPQRTRRDLSSTAQRRRTIPLYNPPVDSSILEITPRAASRLAAIAHKDNNSNLALRIQVESGGCHGFQYLMSLVTLPEDLSLPNLATGPPENANVVGEDDAIFVFVADSTIEGSPSEAEEKTSGAKIILDGPSLHLLKGSKVDFTQELIGSQFKITDNPLATSSCGCGTSFDIKLD